MFGATAWFCKEYHIVSIMSSLFFASCTRMFEPRTRLPRVPSIHDECPKQKNTVFCRRCQAPSTTSRGWFSATKPSAWAFIRCTVQILRSLTPFSYHGARSCSLSPAYRGAAVRDLAWTPACAACRNCPRLRKRESVFTGGPSPTLQPIPPSLRNDALRLDNHRQHFACPFIQTRHPHPRGMPPFTLSSAAQPP